MANSDGLAAVGSSQRPPEGPGGSQGFPYAPRGPQRFAGAHEGHHLPYIAIDIAAVIIIIIISMPFSVSNVNADATMIILPMVVAMMAMTIANVRGNESGAASGRSHRQP
jgi:amino acid transporter